jgi:C1A family cysteine protease
MTNTRYGWRPDKPDHRDLRFLAPPIELPRVVDLRPAMPDVYDQGQLGSCTGNAIAAAIEYMRRQEKLADFDFVPSRLFIYYNERYIEGTIQSDAGAEIRDGIRSVRDWGACSETDWPYFENQFQQRPTDDCYSKARDDLVTVYARVGQTEQQLMACLAHGIPVVFGFTVYSSFESVGVAHTGMVPMPSHDEDSLGGHAVLMVGYDRDRRLFIVRNSWGPDWGDKGYFYMPFDYATNPNLADDFWKIDVIDKV